jgi:hypothetical protein
VLVQAAGAQPGPPVQEFKITGRQAVAMGMKKMLSTADSVAEVTYIMEASETGYKYTVTGPTATFSIDAFSNIEYAKKGNRLVTFGDRVEKHVATEMYASLYTAGGTLLKSLGLVASWPFAATLSENGLFLVAGNKNKMDSAASHYGAQQYIC